jgi:nucleoside-diphosphate-sugar epimerase
MKVCITGAAGFLGKRLAQQLLRQGQLTGASGAKEDIEQIVLLDIVPVEGFADSRVRVVAGDICDGGVLARSIDADVGSVFHLAAVVSGQAEADFDLGMRINLDATRLLLERCRALASPSRVVFTSSVAVYGGELPDPVLDSTALLPQSSYGMQKAVGELLINDYSRKKFIDGRVLRVPTISVRPGKPNKAASSFASGIIREPLAGSEAVCPVPPETRIWLSSPRSAIANLLHAHELPAQRFGVSRVVNLPGISVSAGQMVEALERVAGKAAAARVRWQVDPAITRIVSTWPGAWDCTRALALGFQSEEDFETIIRAYIEDELKSAP